MPLEAQAYLVSYTITIVWSTVLVEGVVPDFLTAKQEPFQLLLFLLTMIVYISAHVCVRALRHQ